MFYCRTLSSSKKSGKVINDFKRERERKSLAFKQDGSSINPKVQKKWQSSAFKQDGSSINPKVQKKWFFFNVNWKLLIHVSFCSNPQLARKSDQV
jgi:hypothetical protein